MSLKIGYRMEFEETISELKNWDRNGWEIWKARKIIRREGKSFEEMETADELLIAKLHNTTGYFSFQSL